MTVTPSAILPVTRCMTRVYYMTPEPVTSLSVTPTSVMRYITVVLVKTLTSSDLLCQRNSSEAWYFNPCDCWTAVTRCMMIAVPVTPVPVTPVVTRPCHYGPRWTVDSVYVASRSDSPVDMHLRRASSELVCTGDSSSSHRDSFGGKSDRKLVDPVDQHRRTSDLLVVPNRE